MLGKSFCIGLRATALIFAVTVFTSSWAATETVLHSFHPEIPGGVYPYDGLILDGAGNLYGTTQEGGAYGFGTVFELTPQAGGGWTENVLYSFGANGMDGVEPYAGLIFDGTGNLYGTTSGGGTYNRGTVFELTPQAGGGWTENVLYSFGNGADGDQPYAGLIFDGAGNLYGTTYMGGTHNAGTVFELMPQAGGGWREIVLHSFNDNGTDGYLPLGGLILDAAGNLYGTTQHGPSTKRSGCCGTVFELTPEAVGGWAEKVLYSFGGKHGNEPNGGLVFDGAGNLYGTTIEGGTYSDGTVFELTPQAGGSWTEKVLHSFGNGTDGIGPRGSLIFDGAGNLYGTTYDGGTYYLYGGAVFELTPQAGGSWTEKVLHSFGNGTDGDQPYANLIFDAAGNLYGTTYGGGTYHGGTVFELTPKAGGGWKEKVPHSFGKGTDAAAPYAGLVFDGAGNLYGTTPEGGTYSYGTVFQLTPQAGGGWRENLLYSFGAGTDGTSPNGGLTIDATGNLYGTTNGGGTYGGGTVFELTPKAGGGWKEKVLYSFNKNGTDGIAPSGNLIFDGAGNLYGTTIEGGTYNGGTVFELMPQEGGGWTENVLYSFSNGTDGLSPRGLTIDAAGNLYGTTLYGGTYSSGTVFELTLQAGGGWTEKVLYSFGNGTDGDRPYAGPIFDGAGNLYGTTYAGGTYDGGTVFELTPQAGGGWAENVLHSFNSNGTDGFQPYAGLIFDGAGNLYGTTIEGGPYNRGTVFELTLQAGGGWAENVLYSFGNVADGFQPHAGLVFDAAGNLYGTTYEGGTYNGGTVFEITP